MKPSDDRLQAFGVRIRELREKAGLSIQQLTERCSFSGTYVSKVENGEILPHIDGVLDLAGALGGSFQDLADLAARVRRVKREETAARALRRKALKLGAEAA